MSAEISTFPTAGWVRDFPRFFDDMLNDSFAKLDVECTYSPPTEFEVSFSRYLFDFNLAIRVKIDRAILASADQTPAEFGRALVSLASELSGDRSGTSIAKQCLAILLYYRAVFHRSYELLPSRFCSSGSANLGKLCAMRLRPVSDFPVPWEFFPDAAREGSIGEFLRRDKLFSTPPLFLFDALFASNPMDQLHLIHRALLAMHKAATIRRLGGREATADDVRQVICFDDLFTLFLTAFAASECPDIDFLSRMVNDYTADARLAPSFEYVQANLEALVVHLEKVEYQ
jgi:hypothetical protein